MEGDMTFLTTAQMIDERASKAAWRRARDWALAAWTFIAGITLALVLGVIAAEIIMELGRACATSGDCIIPPYPN